MRGVAGAAADPQLELGAAHQRWMIGLRAQLARLSHTVGHYQTLLATITLLVTIISHWPDCQNLVIFARLSHYHALTMPDPLSSSDPNQTPLFCCLSYPLTLYGNSCAPTVALVWDKVRYRAMMMLIEAMMMLMITTITIVK